MGFHTKQGLDIYCIWHMVSCLANFTEQLVLKPLPKNTQRRANSIYQSLFSYFQYTKRCTGNHCERRMTNLIYSSKPDERSLISLTFAEPTTTMKYFNFRTSKPGFQEIRLRQNQVNATNLGSHFQVRLMLLIW